jgi:arsenate reductase
MDVQMLGLAKSQATRKAQRFFKERRVAFHFNDLGKRAPTPGELRKWVQRFGVEAVLDPESKAYQEQGLQWVSASDDDWLERMAREPAVLRLPLIRCGKDLSVGDDPAAWARLADEAKAR